VLECPSNPRDSTKSISTRTSIALQHVQELAICHEVLLILGTSYHSVFTDREQDRQFDACSRNVVKHAMCILRPMADP
jgi:hypothetical protein